MFIPPAWIWNSVRWRDLSTCDREPEDEKEWPGRTIGWRCPRQRKWSLQKGLMETERETEDVYWWARKVADITSESRFQGWSSSRRCRHQARFANKNRAWHVNFAARTMIATQKRYQRQVKTQVGEVSDKAAVSSRERMWSSLPASDRGNGIEETLSRNVYETYLADSSGN